MSDSMKNIMEEVRTMHSDDVEFLREMLNKVDRMSDELGRVHRAIVTIMEGRPFTESFDEEIYLESNEDDAGKASSHIWNLITHIFKLKYGTDSMSHDHLRKEIRTFRYNTIKAIKWKGKRQNKTVLKLVIEDLQDTYEHSLKEFKDLIKDNPGDYYISIKQVVELLPDEIPWALEDLMENEIEDLLEILPDIRR